MRAVDRAVSRLTDRARSGSARMRAVRAAVAALREEEGATTAEYAVVILAAVGFAGLLVAILKGDEVRQMLSELVRNALGAGG